MYPNWKSDIVTEYQTYQIPIFKYLINNHLFGYKITTCDQYVGVEKKYTINNKTFWVYIEIEDAKTLESINAYEVWFNYHENSWLPSNPEEESEDYPIKHGYVDTIDELKELIAYLDDNDLVNANLLIDD